MMNHPNHQHLLVAPSTSAPPRPKAIDYEKLERYQSMREHIIKHATKPPNGVTVADVDAAMEKIAHDIHFHYDPEVQSFTEDEQMWLTERRCWDQFMPDYPSKDYLENVRPHNPRRRRYTVEPGVFPPCKACAFLKLEFHECPFFALGYCGYAGYGDHLPYTVRLGAEPRIDDCVVCVEEDKGGIWTSGT